VVALERDLSAVVAACDGDGRFGQTSKRARDDAYDERDEQQVRHERRDDAEDEIAPPSFDGLSRAETPPDDWDLQEQETHDGDDGNRERDLVGDREEAKLIERGLEREEFEV